MATQAVTTAGKQTTVTFVDKGVTAALNKLGAILGGASMGPLLLTIGQEVAENARVRIHDGGPGPEGEQWPPLKFRIGVPLRDKGVHLAGPLHARLASANAVDVGVPFGWAAVHQFGATIKPKNAKVLRFKVPAHLKGGAGWITAKSVRIPARPFLGVGADDRDGILQIIKNAAKAAAPGALA